MNLTKPQKLIYDMEKFAGGAIAVICGSMLVNGKKDLSEIKRAVNELYRLNTALRIRIVETDGVVSQTVCDYVEQDFNVFCFDNKAEMDAYAEDYAKTPLDFYGDLCEINIVTLPNQYGLLIKLHHIIGDAWTLSLLGTQFNKLMNGEEVESYSYAVYVESENAYIQSKRYEKDKVFFVEQFKKCDEVTYLSEKQSDSLNACRKTFVIGKEQTSLINTYAQQKGASAFMLFTAALATYMNRVKMNAERFYIGTAVLNRSGVKENNTVGMFVNTAQMLMELDNTKSFVENLSAIEDTVFSVFRHQKYNYGDVLSTIRKEFNFTEKLYDVMISYQNATVIGADIETTWYHSGSQSESLQMHIDDRDNEGVFRIHYDYLTDKFTGSEIERLHQHICNLLFDAIGDDSKKLYQLNILSTDEKQKLLYEFNNTATDYPRDKCVHQLFEEQVEKTPNSIALKFGDKAFTFAELNGLANGLTTELKNNGVGNGDVVAIISKRSYHIVVAMLAIFKCGAAHLPIDYNYPTDRIKTIANDAGCKVILTYNVDYTADNTIEIPEDIIPVAENVLCEVNPKDICGIIYTSGSTGTPKGTLLHHQGLVNYTYVNNALYEGGSCNIGFAIYTFDAFFLDLIPPMLRGKTAVMATEEEQFNQIAFENLIKNNPECNLFITPAKFKQFVDNRRDMDFFKKIHSICIGGEVFPQEFIGMFSEDTKVYNVYGPTECSMWMLECPVVNEDVTLGKPMGNVQVYILDKNNKLTPIGVTGELCIAGDGVGAGYLNRPELTAEKFIDNPFGEGKLYKTGDLAYWREDGNIAYVGRNDFQVKIRGLRIELGEIENAICDTPGISLAVVVVRKNNEGRQLICAFYTGAEVDAKDIRSHIGKRLPKYMLPHICTHLDEMPLTSSGKINRKALPEVDLYAINTDVEYVAPVTEQEKILVSAIEATLGIDKVGIMDNFFDVGGDSLKAIELISKLEKQGYHTDTKTIFECETVKDLAEKLTVQVVESTIIEYGNIIPATAAQMRVYTAQSMDENSTLYNIPYAFKVDTLDAQKLENAVNTLIDRHESLRTHFENQDGHIVQVIDDSARITVTELESAELSTFVTPFDLTKSPLIRVGYLENTVIVDMHHIICDGGTMPVFFRELDELYMGRTLTEKAVQYGEFAVTRQNTEECEKYWLSVFNDEVPVLELPTDFNRTDKQSFNGNAVYDRIETALHNKITEKCRQLGITPYVFYMSGFNILLSKFSGNEDIVVGMPISGRDAKYLNTVGMFVNTIALRTKPDGDKTVADLLNEVKVNSVAAIDKQNYPFGELVKKLDIDNIGRNPLFDVMLAYQSEEMTDVIFGDKKAELLPIPVTTAKCDLTFNILPQKSGVVVMVEYCTDLYKQETIQRFIESFKLILEQCLNDNSFIKDITAMSEKERDILLNAFNDTAVDYPRDKCIHQLFEEHVVKTPDKIAVVACDKTLTYAELNEQANRIAHSLIEKGIGVGDIVAFALPRKSYLIATMFGILKAGAAYLPVDPDYPQDRIDYMLADSNAKLFITKDNIQDLIGNDDTSNPCVDISSEDLCYCIYTSGSTGKPKGTLLKHQGIVNLVTNLDIYSDLSNCERIGFMTTITFDVATQEILTALLNGFTGVLMLERKETQSDVIIDGVVEHKIDVMYATPTYFDSLTNTKEKADRLLSTIKVVCLAGEKFSLNNNVLSLKDSYNVIFENQYGPVELHVIATATTLQNNDFDSIGKPVGNDKAYIVDQYMRPTPIGVTGELCIAGDGVGAGYLNRPELTAEKFIDNPFGDGKLYKTGDLVYWREDGNIVYVGRNDFQVKIRGLRIELGEIENAICGIDGISQAVVVVRKNNEGRQLICAFYTGIETDAKEIRNHIGKKLPKYMLPHICTHLNEMPLTSSGKINRKALPEVDLYATQTDVEYVAPTTEQEKILVSAIEATLGIDKVGIMDNFFDIGGDSLKAIELISKLEKNGYHTDTKTIFDCETVKELAAKLVAQAIEYGTVEYGKVIPATAAQMRVYTAQSMDEQSTLYNIPYAFKVDTLDAQKLENAVNTLIDRHESLRTHFENQDGRIVQVIDDSARITVTELESEELSAFVKPFDLTKSPLIRVGYYKNTVIVDMHHIICDGGTMPVFFRELNELYMGRAITNNVVQYGEFAVTEQNTEECEKYWLSVFNDEVPVLELPTDFNRTNKQSFKGNAVYDRIDTGLHNKITEKCKHLGITPYVFYMSGFNILLSKFSGNEDIVVGMPISGRDATHLDTVGMFVNTIALRSKPEGNKTVADLLTEVKVNSISAIDNQNYPFGELVKKLHIDNSGRNPLFDVMFAYQSEEMTDVIFGDQKAELLPIPVTTAKCDFTFNILPRKSGVVVMVEYCTDLYKQKTIQRFIDSFKLILEQCLNNNCYIKDIAAMSEKERDVILNDFNDTAVDYPRDKCVHRLFEEQVDKTPDKVAVIACDKTLVYTELNEQANRIAHSLIEKGVGVGDIVAIKLTRKSCLFSSMLGVLKSGAVYMPIDPTYPEDRIEYMLTESKAKYCIDEDNIAELLSNNNTANLNIVVGHNDSFCALHTSGSTGKPKMSLLKHGGMMNFITANQRFWQGIDTVVSATIVTFDAFVMDSVLSVAQGKQVVLASEDEIYNQTLFEGLFAHSESNMFFSTPTKIENYIESSKDKAYLSKIKSFVIGGEVFAEHLLELIKDVSPESAVYNIYGPTETTICVMVDELEKDKEITIGKPIANTRIYIVDKYMQPTPIGVTGELCIAGDGVGAGYLNRPELTAEKFIDNPFGEGKLYKTGDLAYWREDGNIVYVGRNDFQVKIRGLRIELGEIENAICDTPGISLAVVVVRKNNEGRQLICAFYTGAEVDAKDIRSHIGKKLPKYMLPHICTHLDEMPLTSSGKINRKALPEVDLQNITNDAEYVAPETQMQKELCKLIELVLCTTPVGITDDFFDLGGDSLKAIEFVSKAHNEGIYFNLQNVFDYPTVKELCECIENGDKQVISFADVDFTEVNKILEKNKVECITAPQKCDVGNILLAGATGYLGIHILADFLDNDSGTAYCLVRGKDKVDSTKRMQELLNFYFGDKYADMNRIEVICADLQKDKFGLADVEYGELLGEVNTVINCAASVKHYGSYKYFYEANVETTKRLIEFCKLADAKLIHTSTLSVSGNSNAEEFTGFVSEETMYFYESSLYIEQPLDNVYARSKFEAEKNVLDAMCEGLQANIMRMGNLTNRYSDGVFQINHESNAAAQRIKGILELGVIPDYLMDIYCEFTPIDDAAKAVMTITRHFSTEQTVFHANSIKVLYVDKLLEVFNKLGFDLKAVSGAEFTEALRQTAKKTGMEHIFETFINDMDENDQLNYDSNIRIENDFTVQYLKQLGFEWSDIGIAYLRKYVEYFKNIGYLK